MNDVDFPVARVLEGIDAAAAAGLAPIKINMVVKRGVNDDEHPADGAPLPRAAATSCASSSTWTSARPTAGAWTTWCRPPRSSHDRRRAAARAGRPELPRRGRRALALPRRQRRDRRHRLGHAGRSAATARARACRPKASSTPACSPPHGHDLRALLRGGASDEEIARRDRRGLAPRAATATPRSARPNTARLTEGRDVATSAGERHRAMNAPDTPVPPGCSTERRAPVDVRRPRRSTSAASARDDADRRRASADALRRQAELVTLMTLGAAPEALAIGYLRNQRLVDAHRGHRRRAGRLGGQRGRRSPTRDGLADLDGEDARSARRPPAAARARCSAT